MAYSYVVYLYYAVWDIYVCHRVIRYGGETAGVYDTHTGCLHMFTDTLYTIQYTVYTDTVHQIQCTLTLYKVYSIHYV